jgi:hypothetical protein
MNTNHDDLDGMRGILFLVALYVVTGVWGWVL